MNIHKHRLICVALIVLMAGNCGCYLAYSRKNIDPVVLRYPDASKTKPKLSIQLFDNNMTLALKDTEQTRKYFKEMQQKQLHKIFMDSGLFSDVKVEGESYDIKLNLSEIVEVEFSPWRYLSFCTLFLLPAKLSECKIIINAEVHGRDGRVLGAYHAEEGIGAWLGLVFLPLSIWQAQMVTDSCQKNTYYFILYQMQEDGII